MARRRAPLSRLLLLVVLLVYLLNQNDLAWRDLGGTMQRLVLWDQGYVVTSSNKTREILVRCDLGMDDVVVSREEFESLRNCPSTLCTDPASSEIVLRGTICADSEIEKVAKCAVIGGSCPHQLALVIPCATVQSSDNSSEWCTPRTSGVVAGLLQDLVDLQQSQSSDTGTSGVMLAIWVVAGVLTMVLCVIGIIYISHLLQKRKQSSGTRELVEKSTWIITRSPLEAASSWAPMTATMQQTRYRLNCPVLRLSGTRKSAKDTRICREGQRLTILTHSMISRGRDGSPNEVLVGTLGPREVILKRLRASKRNDTRAVERLAREIRMAAMLEHPNIVNIVGIAWNSFQNLMAIWEYHRSGDLRRALHSGRKSQHWTWTRQKLQIAMDRGMLRMAAFGAARKCIQNAFLGEVGYLFVRCGAGGTGYRETADRCPQGRSARVVDPCVP
ncbi:Protein kinase-like domain [Phytophthora cactorum]|nr:Protein kinase-like domain [Phytophthora cactorum]